MWHRSVNKTPKRQKIIKGQNPTQLFKVLASVFFLLALIFSLLNNGFFRIQSIETVWDRDDFYDAGLNDFLEKQYLQKNIFFVSTDRSNLQKVFPNSIKDFSIIKSFPHTLRFNLMTRQPVLFLSSLSENLKSASVSAIINTDGLKQNSFGPLAFWVDAQGIIFNQKVSSLSSLPRVFLDEQRINDLGKDLTSEFFFQFFMEYQRQSQEKSLPALSILGLTKEKEIIARLENGVYLVLPKSDGLVDLFTSLNLILNKYSIEGRYLKKVDLRFKNPVVEFK